MFELKYVSGVDIKWTAGTLPFLLVTTEDGTRYQVKIPNLYSSSMLKEYIAYNIASQVNITTPNATFLYFNTIQISNSLEIIHSYRASYDAKFYSSLEMLKNVDGDIVLFGIEWIEETEVVLNLPLSHYFDNCVSNNLYSIFSFDLLLYNSDRHINNILICSVGRNKYEVYLIDHDRIFNTYDCIENIQDIEDDFECLNGDNTQYLFKYIDNVIKKEKILDFASKYKKITSEDILNFLNTYSSTCPVDELGDDESKKMIKNFILHRIDNIETSCKNNFEKEKCYA